jgi:3-methyladenine DNA glycosylase AlkD
MTAASIIKDLHQLAEDPIRRIFINHGAPSTVLGVKVGQLKTIQKKVKKDHALSLALFNSGIPDAQYLAGLIADEKKISQTDLEKWADAAEWQMISEYTVPWIAAESAHGWKLALKWIDSKNESVQSSGWNTLSSLLSLATTEPDLKALQKLIERVEKEIKKSGNRVRYTMNGFVIAVGTYVPELAETAIKTAARIGKVEVFKGQTSCKVPDAASYIKKTQQRPVKKKKMARC